MLPRAPDHATIMPGGTYDGNPEVTFATEVIELAPATTVASSIASLGTVAEVDIVSQFDPLSECR